MESSYSDQELESSPAKKPKPSACKLKAGRPKKQAKVKARTDKEETSAKRWSEADFVQLCHLVNSSPDMTIQRLEKMFAGKYSAQSICAKVKIIGTQACARMIANFKNEDSARRLAQVFLTFTNI